MKSIYILLSILILFVIVAFLIVRQLLGLNNINVINVIALRNWDELHINKLSNFQQFVLILLAFTITTVYLLCISLLASALVGNQIITVCN